MKTGRHTSVVQTPGQRSTEAVPPPVSAEALRRIIQPQSQPQRPSASTNPPADQDLLSNPVALAPDGSATPGQTPNQTAAGFPELALVSPQTSPTGARGSASTESRLHLYGRSPSAGQSPSEWAAQKSRIDAIFAPWTDGAAIEKGGDSSGTLPAMQRVEETARAFDAPGRIIEHPLRDALSSTPGGEGVSPSQSPPRASLEGAAPQAKVQPKSPGSSEPLLADRAAPKPGDPDSVAQEKFDGYLKSARSHLRQGRYARAAESFSLASVYHPRDARPQIGRSHALLAIGEYLGSAACLAKAIELDPRSTLARSDLIEAIGGPDPFVQRITDLEQCAKTHDAPGLQLLLAYIYQQMDRPEEARDAVRAAKKGLPSSMSVDLLEAAIGTRS